MASEAAGQGAHTCIIRVPSRNQELGHRKHSSQSQGNLQTTGSYLQKTEGAKEDPISATHQQNPLLSEVSGCFAGPSYRPYYLPGASIFRGQ